MRLSPWLDRASDRVDTVVKVDPGVGIVVS